MRTKATVAVGAVLVVGIAVLWPRGGGQEVDLLPPVPSTGPALGDAPPRGVPEVPASARALETGQGDSLHAQTIASAMAAPVEGVKLPEKLRGPPGKPAVPYGATPEEVIAAWGRPDSTKPEMRLPPVIEPEGVEPDGIYNPTVALETWFYGGRSYCSFENGRAVNHLYPLAEWVLVQKSHEEYHRRIMDAPSSAPTYK
jgi:hypothetical protein